MNYSKTLSHILTQFDCETGTLHGIDPQTMRLKLLAHHGIPPFLLDKIDQIPLGKGIAGCAAQREEPVQMCNLQTDTSGIARPDAKQTQVEGALAVPIMDQHEAVVGVLGIGKMKPYEFTPEEISRLQTIAKELVTALSPQPHD
jgi:signal transduction protein with GAF and PtsI domain